jgi:hypothetical protein
VFRDACIGFPTERRPCRSRSIGNLFRPNTPTRPPIRCLQRPRRSRVRWRRSRARGLPSGSHKHDGRRRAAASPAILFSASAIGRVKGATAAKATRTFSHAAFGRFQHVFHRRDEGRVGVGWNHHCRCGAVGECFFRVRPIVLSLAFSTMFNSTMACSPAPEGFARWPTGAIEPRTRSTDSRGSAG